MYVVVELFNISICFNRVSFPTFFFLYCFVLFCDSVFCWFDVVCYAVGNFVLSFF